MGAAARRVNAIDSVAIYARIHWTYSIFEGENVNDKQKEAMQLALDALKDTDADGQVDPRYAADFLTDALALPDAEPAWWLIEYTDNGRIRHAFFRHNAIGDYRALYPDATSTPFYATPQPAIAPEPVKMTDGELAALRKKEELDCISIEAFRCVARATESAIHAKYKGVK